MDIEWSSGRGFRRWKTGMTLSLFQRVCFQTGAHQTHLSCPRKRRISRAGTFVSMATSSRTNACPSILADFHETCCCNLSPSFFYWRITFESDKTSLSRSFKTSCADHVNDVCKRKTMQFPVIYSNSWKWSTCYTFLLQLEHGVVKS